MKPHALFCRATATRIVAIALSAIATTCPLLAGTSAAPVSEAPSESASEPWLAEWWNGKYATGNWCGVRDTLEDRGLKLGGRWIGVYYGVVDGGRSNVRGSFFDEEIKFTGELDFAKLTGWEPLEGLKAFGEVRWRDGLNPNLRVGAASNFQPSHFQSGKQWRLMSFGLTYTTPELFGTKEFLTLTGGWIQPQKEFIEQPLSKLFVNNSFESSKGIGANIPFSSSFTTWGGTLKVKPIDWYYAKVGLFMSYPEATSTDNHGLAFEGFGPDPNQNGLFVIGETGFTPKIGASKLPGKYVARAYYYEEWNNSSSERAIRAVTASIGRSIRCSSGNLHLKSRLPSPRVRRMENPLPTANPPSLSRSQFPRRNPNSPIKVSTSSACSTTHPSTTTFCRFIFIRASFTKG